jgi:hypothetical protein
LATAGHALILAEMKMKLLMSIALFAHILTGGRARGQGAAPAPRLDPTLITYFTGAWTGEGAFANGRPIKADLSFRLSLDSAWLVYEHRDRLPDQYKATSYWGVDARSGQFVAYAFDNFQGHRQFAGNGWVDGRLVLSGQGAVRGGVYFEHFIYQFLSDTQFKMTYETSRDGISWQMGDWLLFNRSSPKIAPGGDGH